MEMPAMHEKVITTESDICRRVPNDRQYAIKKIFMSGALALLVVAYSALASAQTVADKAAQSDTQTAEASFMAENQAAMSKMMKDMTVKPAGNVDADFTAMMIPHHQGAVEMAKAELHYGYNRKLRRIARNIIAGQTQQIGMMKAALGQPLSEAASSATQSGPLAQEGGGPQRNPAR
jgi:uncharacterized membrane protein YeiB